MPTLNELVSELEEWMREKWEEGRGGESEEERREKKDKQEREAYNREVLAEEEAHDEGNVLQGLHTSPGKLEVLEFDFQI